MFKQKILLIAIICLAAVFRFTGVNWDQNTHLHPDERFLTMVGIDLKIPNNFLDYLDPDKSTLNPTNILDTSGNKKYSFYVYGSLPVTLNKIFAVLSDNDNYNGFTITGRMFSAFLDLLVIVLIFKTVRILEEKANLDSQIKYYATFFYAIAVIPIQLSHYFAVDSFLNTFLFLSFYSALEFYFNKRLIYVLICGIFFGFAFASKITALLMLPLLLVFLLIAYLRGVEFKKNIFSSLLNNKQSLIKPIITIFIFLITIYFSTRIANPYLFENFSFLNPQINIQFMQSLLTLKSFSGENVWYPPAVQWYSKTRIIYPLINLAIYGLGIPYFVLSIIGIILLLWRKVSVLLSITIIWLLLFFIYQASQFAAALRYFVLIYPFLAIFAGYSFVTIFRKIHFVFRILIIITVLLWPLSFFSIYVTPHSRIQASEWIYQNLPSGTTIAWELWDDPLPLPLPSINNKTYRHLELAIFDPDTQDKWLNLNDKLNKADYYILSSNRAWGSIPTVPKKYPITSLFYKELFANKKDFVKKIEFTSYPSLKYLGIPLEFPDDNAEETFTVYDHPKVLILKKQY